MAAGIPIAVDMMGGDYAPKAIIGGIAEALTRFGDAYKLYLVGDREQVAAGLAEVAVAADDPRLEIVHADEIIGMDEHPIQAIRNKRGCSINVAMNLVKSGQAQGVFSAGNTGAAVGSSYLKWRMLPGLARPGIATVLPGLDGRWILMDSGATVDCAPMHLAQFAVMGDLYARCVLKKDAPRIGLLSNGTEVGKGNRQTQEAFKLIRDISGLNFIGNVEGHDLFSGKVDVVVCDGFVGNIVLKTSEQLAKSIGKMVKDQIMSRTVWKIGGAMCRGAFQSVKQLTDASETGGAPLLGVNGCCVIGHGNSNPHAVANGIHAVGELVSCRINESIVNQIHEFALDGIG